MRNLILTFILILTGCSAVHAIPPYQRNPDTTNVMTLQIDGVQITDDSGVPFFLPAGPFGQVLHSGGGGISGNEPTWSPVNTTNDLLGIISGAQGGTDLNSVLAVGRGSLLTSTANGRWGTFILPGAVGTVLAANGTGNLDTYKELGALGGLTNADTRIWTNLVEIKLEGGGQEIDIGTTGITNSTLGASALMATDANKKEITRALVNADLPTDIAVHSINGAGTSPSVTTNVSFYGVGTALHPGDTVTLLAGSTDLAGVVRLIVGSGQATIGASPANTNSICCVTFGTARTAKPVAVFLYPGAIGANGALNNINRFYYYGLCATTNFVITGNTTTFQIGTTNDIQYLVLGN